MDQPIDDFYGDNEKLIASINSALRLDTAGRLGHPLGDFARQLLSAASVRLAAATAAAPTPTEAQQRVSAFVAAYEKRSGLDPEQIYSLGTADEPLVLRASDLRALAALPQSPAPLTREALIDLIAGSLSGTYVCGRVWSAWQVGTMTQDDFEEAGESDLPGALADIILAALPQTEPTPVAAATKAAVDEASAFTRWERPDYRQETPKTEPGAEHG